MRQEREETLKRMFSVILMAVVILSLPLAIAREEDREEEEDLTIDSDDRVTTISTTTSRDNVEIDRIAERIGLDRRERNALEEISRIVDLTDANDDRIREMVRRKIESDEAGPSEVYERSATDVETLTRWIEHLDVMGEEVRALRMVASVIDLSDKTEEEVMALIRRQIAAMDDSDDVRERPEEDTEPDRRDVEDEDRARIDIANERLREAFERSAQRREENLDRLRESNPDAAERVKRAYERVSENHRVALDKLDDARVAALVEDEDDIDDILEVSSRVLRRFSPEELSDPSIREMIAERGRQMRELEENQYRVRESRDQPEEARQQAEERREEARRMAEERSEGVRSTREQFQAIREDILSCREDPELDCSEASQVSREHIVSVLEYLSANIESTIATLESSDYVTDEQEERYVSVLEDRAEEISSLLTSVIEATDFSDIAELGREANTLSSEIRSDLQSARNAMSSGTIRGLVAQTTALQRRLDLLLANLESLDMDTSEVDSMLDRFTDHIEAAREQKEELEAILAQDLTGRERGEVMREASEYRRSAVQEIREARDVLNDVFAQSRSLAEEAEVPFGELIRAS